MYILIAGGGIAGSALAHALSERKHDVVVIDSEKERCEQLYASAGVITVNGNCTDIATLKAAGIEKAEVAIGALYRDSDNLTFAILAKSFKIPRVMVKMRDPAYVAVYKQVGVSSVCNMVELFRNKMLMEMENPNIRIISNLENRSAQLVMIRYPSSEHPNGIPINELAQHEVFARDCVFTGIFNEESQQIIMPRGADKVYPGDKLFMVVQKDRIKAISDYVGQMASADGYRKK